SRFGHAFGHFSTKSVPESPAAAARGRVTLPGMELRTIMRTTPATRAFTDDQLPDDVLYDILDDARFAPNGGNRQAWHVIVVRDPATKERIAALYELGMREYAAHIQAGLIPFVASEAFERTPPGSPYRPAVDLEAARRTPLEGG